MISDVYYKYVWFNPVVSIGCLEHGHAMFLHLIDVFGGQEIVLKPGEDKTRRQLAVVEANKYTVIIYCILTMQTMQIKWIMIMMTMMMSMYINIFVQISTCKENHWAAVGRQKDRKRDFAAWQLMKSLCPVVS